MIRLFFAFEKRNLCKLSYLLLLFLFPLLFLVGGEKSKDAETSVKICLLDETNKEFQQAIIKELQANSDSLFEFIVCQREEECKKLVSTRQAECAFIFMEDLEEAISQENLDQSIIVYLSPTTQLEALASERVYTAIFSAVASNHFQTEIERKFGSEVAKQVREKVKKYQENGSTFYVDYKYLDSSNLDNSIRNEESKENTSNMPFRGLLALLVFLYGMLGLLTAKQDQEQSVLVGNQSQKVIPVIAILASILPAGIVGFLTLWVAAGKQMINWKGIGYESIVFLFYLLLLTGYQMVLYRILSSSLMITAAIPIILLLSTIICPIFFSFGSMFQIVGILEKLFPVTWYLRMFN